jgi:hypothetical protein
MDATRLRGHSSGGAPDTYSLLLHEYTMEADAGGSAHAAAPPPPAPGTDLLAAVAGEYAPDDDDDDGEDGGGGYSVDHLSAVIRPVALTMILAALAVSKIRDPAQDAAISSGLSMYLVYNEGSSGGSGGGNTGDQIGQAIVNAVVIVCVIAVATFVLVACYYFRCLKLMIAYLIFACINLLGYSGGFMVMSAVTVYQGILDYLTLALLMFNFAVGGAVAVFWQKGSPRYVTQGYLIATSVIMAWILTKLPEWTSWALLVALAVYDLVRRGNEGASSAACRRLLAYRAPAGSVPVSG